MRVVAVGLAAALVLPVFTSAQGQGRARGQSSDRVAQMDRNRDGVVTRDEWRGSDRSFQELDWNKDGRLSGDELRAVAGQAARGRDQQDAGLASEAVEFSDWTARGFAGLDRNGDGQIARDEWRFDQTSFKRADTNRDGMLSRAEFLATDATAGNNSSDRFRRMDDDADGRVSRVEWWGAPALFDALDGNRDGVLSGTELDAKPAPELFDRMDTNRNGRVSQNEWVWSPESFTARDVNRDGQITKTELGESGPQGPEGRSPAYKAGYERGMRDGRAAGREDLERHQGWDLEGQRELENADAGYEARTGARAEYQAGYRDAFRVGYREGFGR